MNSTGDTGAVSETTAEFEDEDAQAHAVADRAPTDEEAAAADTNTLDPHVAESHREANERGANVRGEGQID